MVEFGKLLLKHHPSFSITIFITTAPCTTGVTAPYINHVASTTSSFTFHELSTVKLPPTSPTIPFEELLFEIPRLNNPYLHEALQNISQKSNLLAFFIDFFCFLERTKDKGLVVKPWAPQLEVLNHDSIRGFVTHCGWNSALESICAEQRMNRVFMVEELKVALGLTESTNGFVTVAELDKRIRELMDSDNRKATIQESGSSRVASEKCIESWAKIWKAKECLNIFPTSSNARAEADIVDALTVRLPNLGMKLLPMAFRQIKDPMEIIKLAINCQSVAYRNIDELI
ncbi:UDP-glycosyltransferase 88A1-like [Olea europaea subsp. europaea]|uniref:UDP-glycosyltransferase 88A1-like n=1 Tax=Olea europaea subsp. europaea TaxID=158383 RepID=A0A8S0PVY5_OLEEU|nr:UDP-glycosyltransferase 88A1-like [Olea europaea subsp. europaea]